MIDAVAGRQRLRRVAWRMPRARVLIALLAAVVLIGGGWLWLRDSSLVAVKRVTIVGATGADASQVRSALVLAARDMTTLDVHVDQLKSAVAQFPAIKDLRVSTQFPHGMQIQVIEQIPVGVVVVDGRRIAVAGDGTLLHDVIPAPSLPVIPLRLPPGGARLTDRGARDAVALLAAAPYQLLQRVSQIAKTDPHGLTVQLRNGPTIYFGDATQAVAKWIAASEVMADPGSAGAAYVDVTDPHRPAAGTGATTGSSASAAGASGSAGAATAATSAGASATASAASAVASGASSAAGTGAATTPTSTLQGG